jgi:lipoate-protein ligase A
LVTNYRRQEKLIHKKEFFKVSVPEAINTIREQCGDKIKYEEVIHITPEELKKASSRKTLIGLLKVVPFIALALLMYFWFEG